MVFERAYLLNGTDIVAADNIFDAKEYWLTNNKLAVDPKIKECDLDRDGLYVEVVGEMEAVEFLALMQPGDTTHFKKTKDGMLLIFIKLREALKGRDSEEPYFLAKVGM